jgi:hypothetical protein
VRPLALVYSSGVSSDIASLQMKPDGGEFQAGATIQLNLFATTRRGKIDLIPGNAATWGTSSGAIAEVNRLGRLSLRRAGTAVITATYGGQTARAAFTVREVNAEA